MTYFASPDHAAAYFAGVTLDAYYTAADAAADAEEILDAEGRPDLDREDRDLIDYADVEDPETPAIRRGRYGSDHWVYVPGASD